MPAAAFARQGWGTLPRVAGTHAVQPEHSFLPDACRCFPSFDDALTADIISSVTGRSANVSSARSTFASTFNKPGARLQRYIADIYKGILIIVAAGGSRHGQLCAPAA